jgi:DNA modification methylase
VTWEILQGDCIERMAEFEENSVDAVVCDPPYGIGFMDLTPDEIGECYGEGVKSRLVEYCQIQAMAGGDQRLLAARERMGLKAA